MDNIKMLLHILRNPYGWTEDQQREHAIAAADLIEDLLKRLENEPAVERPTGLQCDSSNTECECGVCQALKHELD